MTERRTKVISLFGREAILSERTARDVNKLITLNRNSVAGGRGFSDVIIEAAITVADGLKVNYEGLPWWRWPEKAWLRRRYSLTRLMDRLSNQQIFTLAGEVYELEGVSPEKKKSKGTVPANG